MTMPTSLPWVLKSPPPELPPFIAPENSESLDGRFGVVFFRKVYFNILAVFTYDALRCGKPVAFGVTYRVHRFADGHVVGSNELRRARRAVFKNFTALHL